MNVNLVARADRSVNYKAFSHSEQAVLMSLTGNDVVFLLQASRLLNATLGAEETAATIARLSLPHLGSWCILDLSEGDETRRVAIIHPDPQMQSLADDLASGWPPQSGTPLGIPEAVRSGRTQVVYPISDEMLIASAGTPENLALLRALEIGSIMTVPLITHGELLGAITYVSPNHGDSFGEHDKILAEDLAGRCAVAIEHARLLDAAYAALRDAEAARKEAHELQKKAEDANMVKLRFLSTMSHELRTPLNAIAGYADLLDAETHGKLTDGQRKFVDRIRSAEQHLLALVESVLDYAKIDAGRAVYGLEEIPLSAVLAQIDPIIAPLLHEKHISCLNCSSGASAVTVHADPVKLLQLLVNLVGNAIKFTPDGGMISVSEDHTLEQVRIHVADTGVGIAPEDQELVFEPFIQVENGTDRTHGGTGLGLAISRELAAGMGGDLSLVSRVGKGSIFTVTLPRGHG